MTQIKASIFGCLGPSLTQSEFAFFREVQPWGFILFARNIIDPQQTRALCTQLRMAVGRDAPILIDQEGGRVQRLRAPHWREWLPPLDQSQRVKADQQAYAMWLRYRLIAAELYALGIDVNCAPMLDIASPQTHHIIYNRCYSEQPDHVSTLGRAVANGLLDGGVLPIIKHIPGHGRGRTDSHVQLPKITADAADLAQDLMPFRALRDLPMAMSAHILYTAWDADLPATLSPKIVKMIRDEIGFDGLLMTDDLSMRALGGSYESRARLALDAGCDMILHCNGKPAEMAAIASHTPALSGHALRRAENALSWRKPPQPFDCAKGWEEFCALLRTAD